MTKNELIIFVVLALFLVVGVIQDHNIRLLDERITNIEMAK